MEDGVRGNAVKQEQFLVSVIRYLGTMYLYLPSSIFQEALLLHKDFLPVSISFCYPSLGCSASFDPQSYLYVTLHSFIRAFIHSQSSSVHPHLFLPSTEDTEYPVSGATYYGHRHE